MLLAFLAMTALALTCTMFATRQSMLGFAATMFWAITGAQAYALSTAPWGDIYFYYFFASMFGMTIFCATAAYGLRAKKDTGTDADEYADEARDEGKYMDEGGDHSDEFIDESAKPSRRTLALRKRAETRRTGKTKKGEFDW